MYVKVKKLKGECCCGNTMFKYKGSQLVLLEYIMDFLSCCYGNTIKYNGKLYTTNSKAKIQFKK